MDEVATVSPCGKLNAYARALTKIHFRSRRAQSAGTRIDRSRTAPARNCEFLRKAIANRGKSPHPPQARSSTTCYH
ncbi:hypothetical protein BN2476_570031 [Paraburkholderia piptadeniae]|uniref:Uncharacterized protein n=1 Tax=Paraburkholderia piptadeniae TaxID=1701573 RepID=A0A1N7SJA3_9BURK|nr:hypothetical protein BN2476_570031 [Paraburkholderia piptadeniae]